MGILNFGKKTPITSVADPVEQYVALAELNAMGENLPDQIKNIVDSSHTYAAYSASDDFGNFFGSEFDIRATAGRIKGAYTREPWMYAAATVIARMLATVPYVVKNKKTGEIDDAHPLNMKLKAANELQSNMETQWCGYLDLVLGGNFFLAFDSMFNKAMQLPVELIQMKIAPDHKSIEKLVLWDNTIHKWNQEIDYKQVIHQKYPNPFNPYYGLSMFTAAARPILLDRYKNEFEMAFYLRGATNTGVIETTEDINKTRMERLMRTFEQVYTGKRNWWRTIFLPKGAKWIASGLTMSEMQHLEGLRENRLTLLAVLGVPPSQVGIVQDVNRSTAETQERAMWTNTLVPLAKFIAEGWNNSYLVKTIYQGQVYVEADFSDIEALQGSLETKGAQAKSVEPYFTINEIRENIFKAEKHPKGDVFVAELVKPAAAPGAGAPTGSTDPLAALGEENQVTAPQISLNGAQVSSIVEIVSQVNAGTLTVDSAVAIIMVAFAIDEQTARDIVGDGEGTVPPAEDNPIDEVIADTTPPEDVPEEEEKPSEEPKEEEPKEEETEKFVSPLVTMKEQSVTNQERLERNIAKSYVSAYDKYVELMLEYVEEALRKGVDVAQVLKRQEDNLTRKYIVGAESALVSALERGFSFAASQSKILSAPTVRTKTAQKLLRFSSTDQQAIDALRSVQADGRRTQLLERAITSFSGFNKTRTNEILDLIAERAEEGASLDQIAATLRTTYTEKYKNQAFTIARTEVLTAISEGIKWNHDVLQEVFSEVQKQWFHVGDAGSNPDARENHYGFELEGPQPAGHKWGGILAYPRDPAGGADQTINCRCTMVSVIPDDAVSNADVILENI